MGRSLDTLEVLRDNEIRMYTCGPTVWNYPHIGNYRTFLFEDLLRRFLKYRGYKVKQVMNLTDVDDRIIKTCNEQKIALRELTKKYEDAFFQDLVYLAFDRAEFYLRATDYIHEMVKIIEGLLAKGIAYRSEDGSVYFSIAKFPAYGKLSGLKPSELKTGARVRQDDYDKSSAQDFALWKAWDEDDGMIFWETALGKGRPGWHIECSAMSMKILGEQFDIHTGGVDLIFPHHENEIAQSESFTGKEFAKLWLHSEHLMVNDLKMAKRLGNFITVNELRERGYDGRSIRLALLSVHYRSQLNFSENSIVQAQSSIHRVEEFVSRLLEFDYRRTIEDYAVKLVENTRRDYVLALDNDLDSPSALSVFYDLLSDGNKLLDDGRAGKDGVAAMLDFVRMDFNSIFAALPDEDFERFQLNQKQLELLDQREIARKSKDWQKSDSLRISLAEEGIEVQDTPEGQKWRRKASSS